MADKKEMTAQTASVSADAGQSLTIKNTIIIPETSEKFNGEYDFPGTFPNITDPHFLPAISIGTLYETACEGTPLLLMAFFTLEPTSLQAHRSSENLS